MLDSPFKTVGQKGNKTEDKTLKKQQQNNLPINLPH